MGRRLEASELGRDLTTERLGVLRSDVGREVRVPVKFPSPFR
jgi:hypothetical protein